LREIFVQEGNVIRFEYQEPFASLFGSHKTQIVDLAGRCVNRLELLGALRQEALDLADRSVSRGC
jgi:hypothetical protein